MGERGSSYMFNEFYARLFAIAARIREDEEGQGLVEYALILVLVSIASIALMTTLGTDIGEVFTQISAELN